MIVLHASDVHFGSPHRAEASAALVRFTRDTRPDAVVVSGDLTQRAKVREYEAARSFLDELAPYPVVTVPGNHDVPLYRFWERAVSPFRNYRRYIDGRLDCVVDVDGARFVGLSSAAPRTAIVNGRIRRRQLAFAAQAFAAAPAGAARVLVVHHNLIDPGDHEPGPALYGATAVLREVHRWRVDCVLSGHIHRTSIRTSADGLPAGIVPLGVPLIHTGTTTSSRGRGKEKGRNSLNLIRVEQSGVEISVYFYSSEAERFLPGESHRYPRAFG